MTIVMEVQDVVRSRLRVLIHECNAERARRGKKPLTIRQISKLSGVSTSAISGLTTNRITRYDSSTLQALCRFFNCTPGDILEYAPKDEDFRPGPITQYTPTRAATDYAQRKLLQDPWLEAD